MAIAVLDSWLAAAAPNGLLPTHYDNNIYTNGHAKTVDACNLGTAAVQLFEAERNARILGIDRPAYGQMAIRICDFALKVMDNSGRIGKSWLELDLSPAVKEGAQAHSLRWHSVKGQKRLEVIVICWKLSEAMLIIWQSCNRADIRQLVLWIYFRLIRNLVFHC